MSHATGRAPSRREVLRTAAAGCAVWTAAWAATPATAQTPAWPSRPIRLVVPYPPGGINDSVGRLLADALQAQLKQTVVVDNRPGAAGLIGTQAVADAPPDGHTLLVTSTSNHVLAPLTQKSARIDPSRDLQPVALALRTVGLLAVPAPLPARTLGEFIALAKSQPGALNYGSSGVGSANHVGVERFKALAGVDIVHVPFRGGGPLTTALMAGEVQLALMDHASVEPALQSGRVRVLVQTGARRHPALPAVPTLAEAGFRDYDPSFWIGLAAPKGTPAAVVAALAAAVDRVLATTAVKARAQALGWTLVGGGPAVLAETAAREVAAYRQTVAGLALDRQ